MERSAAEPGPYSSDNRTRSTTGDAATLIDFNAFAGRMRSKNDGGLVTDIVSAVTHLLTPDLVEKISSAADLDRASGQMAIEAVVPVILSDLVELADKPGGASRLARAVAAQPSDALSALGRDLDDLSELEVRGGSVLSALLGESPVRKVAWIIGSYTGIGERSARTLMDLLMPVVLDTLGRRQSASDLDAEGLSRLLRSERQRITAAMPPGLTELLKDELDEEAGLRSLSSLRWPDALSPRHPTMQRVMSDGAERELAGGEWSAWALPLLIVLGFVWWYSLIWWLLLPSSPPRVAETPRTSQTLTAATQKVSGAASTFISRPGGDWVSINGYFNKQIYDRNGDNLGMIKDVLIGPDGNFNAAIIAVHQDLGLGDKHVAVPFAALHLEQRSSGARLIFDATRDALQKAPAFEAHPVSEH